VAILHTNNNSEHKQQTASKKVAAANTNKPASKAKAANARAPKATILIN